MRDRVSSLPKAARGEECLVLTNRHFLLKDSGEPVDLIDVETIDNRHTISRIDGEEFTRRVEIVVRPARATTC